MCWTCTYVSEVLLGKPFCDSTVQAGAFDGYAILSSILQQSIRMILM